MENEPNIYCMACGKDQYSANYARGLALPKKCRNCLAAGTLREGRKPANTKGLSRAMDLNSQKPRQQRKSVAEVVKNHGHGHGPGIAEEITPMPRFRRLSVYWSWYGGICVQPDRHGTEGGAAGRRTFGANIEKALAFIRQHFEAAE